MNIKRNLKFISIFFILFFCVNLFFTKNSFSMDVLNLDSENEYSDWNNSDISMVWDGTWNFADDNLGNNKKKVIKKIKHFFVLDKENWEKSGISKLYDNAKNKLGQDFYSLLNKINVKREEISTLLIAKFFEWIRENEPFDICWELTRTGIALKKVVLQPHSSICAFDLANRFITKKAYIKIESKYPGLARNTAWQQLGRLILFLEKWGVLGVFLS